MKKLTTILLLAISVVSFAQIPLIGDADVYGELDVQGKGNFQTWIEVQDSVIVQIIKSDSGEFIVGRMDTLYLGGQAFVASDLAGLFSQPLDSLLLDSNANNSYHNPYKIFADTSDPLGALGLYIKEQEVTAQIPFESWMVVYNNTGSTILN
ncbi:MAG: hypothetical protein R3250_11895, partial [Melioribacteraceae bacterium]|nr:hypothetical protein [Melioribacteraceae bacterium]